MSNFVTAVYSDRTSAELAAERLVAAGCPREDICLLMSDGTHGRDFSMEQSTKAPEGAATGGAIGGVLGAIAAGVVGVGAFASGGAGLLAAGPIVAALAGAGAGGATGGVIGALVGAGMPEYEAKVNADRLEKGDILVGAQVHDDRLAETKKALEATGGTGLKKS